MGAERGTTAEGDGAERAEVTGTEGDGAERAEVTGTGRAIAADWPEPLVIAQATT
jgi:hypothetical protein